MPARCGLSYAARRFVSHWFGDLPPTTPAAREWLLKYSEASASLFDIMHTEILASGDLGEASPTSLSLVSRRCSSVGPSCLHTYVCSFAGFRTDANRHHGGTNC